MCHLPKSIPMRSFTQHFASDNCSGFCPESLDYLVQANVGHALSYGDDEWTAKASNGFRELFETDCDVFFVFNGTAANSLALAALCRSYHSIICCDTAHIETDECGAPEFFSKGSKLLTGPGCEGKLTPTVVEAIVRKRSDIHYPKPKVISVSQATEIGTVYQVAEIAALHETAARFNLRIHMDGARFANAVESLGEKPAELTWKNGVDVLCFGGTKNGMPMGEAIIFFNRDLAQDFDFHCKQAGQLASKMRMISAPWAGMLETGAWMHCAAQANAAARKLEQRLREFRQVQILFPREANSVFVEMPPSAVDGLHAIGWRFYSFIGVGGARFMCSWDTSDETIDALIADLQTVLS